jgi:LuxR family maltose regulon positive regulatory protein
LHWQRFDSFDRAVMYTPMSYGFASYGIGLSHLWEGRNALAEQVLRPALARAEEEMGRRNLVTCMLAALLARASWESGSEDEPVQLLALRIDVLERQGLPDALLSAYLTLARIAEQAGKHDKALSLLEELRAIGVVRNIPRLHFAAQCEMIRQHARQGHVETAESLSRQLGLTFEAQRTSAPRAYLPWLNLQLELAKAHAALAHQGADHLAEALRDLDLACSLADQLNLGREGIESRLMRCDAMRRMGMTDTVATQNEVLSLAQIFGQRRICDQHGMSAVPERVLEHNNSKLKPTTGILGSAILTIKEREILALLAQNLSNKEIAITLDVSEQTVKWHLKNLFLKLNGANRKHAVARARILGLVQ